MNLASTLSGLSMPIADDDAICFDDESAWDPNSGNFSFADDSYFDASKNISASTPAKAKPTPRADELEIQAKTSEEPMPSSSKEILAGLFPKVDIGPAVESAITGTATVIVNSLVSPTVAPSDEHPKVVEGHLSNAVKTKLQELEKEIQEFKSQNDCLAQLRREKEDTVANLKRELEDFQRQKNEELKRLEDFKLEETKRLKKDRKSFEEMQKVIREKTERRDNEEITRLKTETEDLQEELQKRSARWAQASTRLREKIACLTSENNELKEEIARLKEKAKKDLLKRHTVEKINPALLFKPEPSKTTGPKLMSKVEVEKSKPSLTLTNKAETSSLAKHHANIRNRALAGHLEPGKISKIEPSKNQREPVNIKPDSTKKNEPFSGKVNPVKPKTAPTTRLSPLEEEVSVEEPEEASVSPPVLSPSRVSSSRRSLDTLLEAPEEGDVPTDGDTRHCQYPASSSATSPDTSGVPVEETLDDGSKVIYYHNGTEKRVSPCGTVVTCTFFNGDTKTQAADGTVVYCYAATRTKHTTFLDDKETLEFENGQVETCYSDGTKEVKFPDGTVKKIYPSGNEDSIFPDGTVIHCEPTGRKVINFPNGQKEIHEHDRKSRSYPDGTVKTVYNDGTQETKYASGRRRVKDKDGNVVIDSVFNNTNQR